MEAIPLPNSPKITDLGGNKYELVFEPLYPGFGVTVGNALRRVLLSSMPGSAVTAVKIKFVDHEFQTIPGIKEDVIQLILNLKRLQVRSHSMTPVKISLKAKGEGVVTAGQITETDQVEVINKDLVIATVDGKAAELDLELTVEQGRGYVPVEAREQERHELGELAIDAIFTPIKSVFFEISHVRVGQMTNYDKLSLHLETNGSMSGQEALDITSRILVDHFSLMFSATSFVASTPEETLLVEQAEETPVQASEDAMESADVAVSGTEIDALNLSTRAKNALVKSGITTLDQLKALSNEDIDSLPGLGKKTVTEILTLLARA